MTWPTVVVLITIGQTSATPNAESAPDGKDITWRSVGPGGGGWIQSITWDPIDAETLHVGCDVGGYYFSADAGQHYEIRNAGLVDFFFEALAVHPRDPRIILAGTESGIHRSADQGRTWQWIRQGFPPVQQFAFSAPIGAIAFDPQRPSRVYAGIGRPRWNKEGAGAIYCSDDTGLTWRLISAGQLAADAIVRDIELKPGDSQTILVATQRGIFRSHDSGQTWTPSNDGLPQANVEELAFAPSSPDTVYASLQTTARDNQPFDGGVCRSDDAGKTWRPVNGEGMPRRVGGSSQSPYMTSQIKELAVDPRDPNVVYAGSQSWVTAGVYKSVDGGQHWTRTTRHGQQNEPNMDYGWISFWGPAVECLSVSTVRPGRIAFGTSGHVFTSDNGGETWQQRYCRQIPAMGTGADRPDQSQPPLPDGRFSGNGLEVTCLNAVVPDPTARERLWFCYADIGLLVSDDGGQSFRRSFQGMKHSGNCFTVVVDPAETSTVWAATGQWSHNAGDICRSDDGGRTWQIVGTPDTWLPDGQVRHLVLDARSPAEQRRLLATVKGSGIYESRDGGRSWHPIHGDLPVAAVKEPRGLLIAPADPQHLVVALGGVSETGAGIYATRDGGRSWKRLHEAGMFANITSLAADPQDMDCLYVTARQHYDHATRKSYPGGLFVSRDGGRNWNRLLDFRFIQAVAVSSVDRRILYVGTNDHPYHDAYAAAGLLKSHDGGLTWQRENSGLSHRGVHCLSISPHDPSLLYLGTGGNGAFIGKDTVIRSSYGSAPASKP